jgi:hypothetical protein
VRALAYVPDGRIAAGGAFTTAGGQVSAYFGTLASSCPATVSSFGAGCSGAGGANALAATDLPWLGATFRAVANGMPVTGIAAAAYGFTALPALPLAALHPAGGAGCTLDVFPDHHVAHAVAGMPLSTQLAIPRTISLIGMAFHEQVVPFEISAANNIVLVTSTNALTATIGVL